MKAFIGTVEIMVDYCTDEESAKRSIMHLVHSNEAKIISIREVEVVADE